MTIAMQSPAPVLVSADTVALVLDVTPATVRQMARSGDLPAIRVGIQWRFPVDSLARAVAGGDVDLEQRLAESFRAVSERGGEVQ